MTIGDEIDVQIREFWKKRPVHEWAIETEMIAIGEHKYYARCTIKRLVPFSMVVEKAPVVTASSDFFEQDQHVLAAEAQSIIRAIDRLPKGVSDAEKS